MNEELVLRNHLKVARAEKKLSQTQLAEMVGVSRNTISSIETGQFNPTAKLALILCIALDKKFEELFFSILKNISSLILFKTGCLKLSNVLSLFTEPIVIVAHDSICMI